MDLTFQLSLMMMLAGWSDHLMKKRLWESLKVLMEIKHLGPMDFQWHFSKYVGISFAAILWKLSGIFMSGEPLRQA